MADSELEDARIQLAILKMKEEVKKSVETDLFKHYRNLGSVIFGVLGVAGITIGWPALTRLVEQEISAQVKEPVMEARNSAQEANKIANDILIRLEEKQLRLQDSMGRADHKFEVMTSRYGTTTAQIDEIDESLSEMRKIVDFMKAQVSPRPVSLPDDKIDSALTTLATQTNMLAAEVAKLSDNTQDQEKLKQIKEQLAKITQGQPVADNDPPSSDLRASSVVYVQFAGGERQRAASISKSLSTKGWRVPGEERLAAAADKHEVRYFHESDKKAAELLVLETNETIADAGFNIPLVKVIKSSVKSLPAKGILEIWLEIPPS